jgi:hypothetical protein
VVRVAAAPQFASALGLGNQRPDLVVRFGRGPTTPLSMRRPVQALLIWSRVPSKVDAPMLWVLRVVIAIGVFGAAALGLAAYGRARWAGSTRTLLDRTNLRGLLGCNRRVGFPHLHCDARARYTRQSAPSLAGVIRVDVGLEAATHQARASAIRAVHAVGAWWLRDSLQGVEKLLHRRERARTRPIRHAQSNAAALNCGYRRAIGQ